jgi:carboxyl-terminal processing protease
MTQKRKSEKQKMTRTAKRKYRNRTTIGCLVVFGILFAVTIAALTVAAPKRVSPYRQLQLFARVLAHLEREYVSPIDKEKLIVGAIKGMVKTLDPHSSFLIPEEYEIFEADTRGEFGGVGMEVGIRNGRITVITPMPDSPAERAGIEPGDQLIGIDNVSAVDMNIEEAIRLMRGVPGTTVKTTFSRPGVEKPISVTLERAVIRVESVRAERIAPGFLWIQVRSFQDTTTGEVKAALKKLSPGGKGLKGVLLDLRRNPGGVLYEAVALSDLFIPSGVLLTTRGRGDKTLETYRAKRYGTIEDVPLIVLIDGASASAAEIVAGALQDYGRALLVGTKSFGKGSVQSLIEVGEGYGLKLTVARYFTPKGRSIQAEGIIPDVVVESRLPPEPDSDTRLLAALPSEKDLPGHLAPKEKEKSHEGAVEIADFQLRIAMQLLMGLANQVQSRAGEWQ